MLVSIKDFRGRRFTPEEFEDLATVYTRYEGRFDFFLSELSSAVSALGGTGLAPDTTIEFILLQKESGDTAIQYLLLMRPENEEEYRLVHLCTFSEAELPEDPAPPDFDAVLKLGRERRITQAVHEAKKTAAEWGAVASVVAALASGIFIPLPGWAACLLGIAVGIVVWRVATHILPRRAAAPLLKKEE